MSTIATSGLSGRRVGRYVLNVLVREHGGCALWQADDPALARSVAIRLIPADDPRVPQLRRAAQQAASLRERRLVQVLDVIDTPADLAVVTEWVVGYPWSDLLTEAWNPEQALLVVLEAARALESASADGVTHGRLRPDSVMITDSGEVRVRGAGIDAALWGCDPPVAPARGDLHGLGALLYAGLTRHWPQTTREPSPFQQFPAAPMRGGRILPPSAVSPEVPAVMDDLVARTLVNAVPSHGRPPFTDLSQCAAAMEQAAAALGQPPEPGVDRGQATDRLVGRLGTAAIAVLVLAGIVLLGWQLWTHRASSADADTGGARAQPTATPYEPALPEVPYAIVGATSFDPYGDGTERPTQVPAATDRDLDTAWSTDTYASADLDGKAGVGLVLDLGVVRPVKAFDLKLLGTGTDFAILTSQHKHRQIRDFRKAVEIIGAGEQIRVRIPRAIDARYVLVWLTRLPYDGYGYRGGIRSVKVLG